MASLQHSRNDWVIGCLAKLQSLLVAIKLGIAQRFADEGDGCVGDMLDERSPPVAVEKLAFICLEITKLQSIRGSSTRSFRSLAGSMYWSTMLVSSGRSIDEETADDWDR